MRLGLGVILAVREGIICAMPGEERSRHRERPGQSSEAGG